MFSIFHLYLEGRGWFWLTSDLDLHLFRAHDQALFIGLSLGMTSTDATKIERTCIIADFNALLTDVTIHKFVDLF